MKVFSLQRFIEHFLSLGFSIKEIKIHIEVFDLKKAEGLTFEEILSNKIYLTDYIFNKCCVSQLTIFDSIEEV